MTKYERAGAETRDFFTRLASMGRESDSFTSDDHLENEPATAHLDSSASISQLGGV